MSPRIKSTQTSQHEDMQLEGNDFDLEQIELWYRDEERHHDRFTAGRAKRYPVLYEILDSGYAFDKHFKPHSQSKVLSFGCAEGNDLERYYRRYGFKLHGIEASNVLISSFKEKFPGSVVKKANISGKIDFEDSFFDYVSVISVLHHIPNVSYVLSELARVLKQGGTMIIREPVFSMKSHSRDEGSLSTSPRERGIAVPFFLGEFKKCGLDLLEYHCGYFSPLVVALNALSQKRIEEGSTSLLRISRAIFVADQMLSRVTENHIVYEAENRSPFGILSPTIAYYVVRKPCVREEPQC